jgi:tetratricopeptide (TPR) repeat protein
VRVSLSVIEGRDGWLFLEDDGINHPLKSARDLTQWRQELLPKIVANAQSRNVRLQARNIPFIIILVPECATIYPETLPFGYKVELPSAAEQAASSLAALGLDVLCPSEVLRASKPQFEVFLRHDTHWTVRGAQLCYGQLMDRVAQYLPVPRLPEECIRFGTRFGFGDLGIHLRPERRGLIQTVDFIDRPVQLLANMNDQHLRSFRHAACAQGTGRLLLFRDSAANALLPFLERTFAETISIAPSPQVLDDAVDRFQPDLVILEISEPGLFRAEFAFTDWDQRSFQQLYFDADDQSPVGRLYGEAVEHLQEGRAAASLAAAASAALLDTSGAQISTLAWAMLNAGEYAYCQELAARVGEGRQDRFLHHLHSQAAYRLEDWAEAATALDRARAIQPENAQYLYSAAELHFRLGEYEAAARAAAHSIRNAPIFERSWLLLISSLRRLGDDAAAGQRQSEADELFGKGRVVPE